MTDTSASPDPIHRERPTKYPAHLAVMLPAEQKKAIVDAAAAGGESQGEVVRRWLELGRELDMPGVTIERDRFGQITFVLIGR